MPLASPVAPPAKHIRIVKVVSLPVSVSVPFFLFLSFSTSLLTPSLYLPSSLHMHEADGTCLQGSLCPGGAVIKLSGKEIPTFRGPAKCFDTEQAALAAIVQGDIKPNDCLVIRYQGPAVRLIADHNAMLS